MKIEVNRNVLAGALVALGKLVCRTSPVEEFKSVQIEKIDNELYFRTCNSDEVLEFKVVCEAECEFVCVMPFDEFRNAVKGGKNKSLAFEYEAGVLLIDGKAMTLLKTEWPKVSEPPADVIPHSLPDNFLEMLKTAALIVNRNEPRRVLQEINLSRNGVTATNGKELVNIESQLGIDSFTIPFPLALLSMKEAVNGQIFVWLERSEWLFKMTFQTWTWTGKTLPGIYPNWKQVIPAQKFLTHSVSFLPERGEQLAIFLKNVPDSTPNNSVEISMTGTTYLNVQAGDRNTSIAAESPFDWGDYSLPVNKNLLLRLLSEGHTKIECADGHMPFIATGGLGRYIAMPIFQKNEPKIEPQTIQENPMESNEIKVVSAPVQTVAQNINHESETEAAVNPLDDLGNCIEAFKNKIKNAFEETALLARKVKEVQLAQKQKERDFILAKRAIERIRMVSSF